MTRRGLLGQTNRLLVSAIELRKIMPDLSRLLSTAIKTDLVAFIIQETNLSGQRVLGTGHVTISERNMHEIDALVPKTDGQFIMTDTLSQHNHTLRKMLQKSNIAVLVRLSNDPTGEDALGYMMLGYKKSGRPYNNQDKVTLQSVADVLAIAIQNALRLKRFKSLT